MSSLPPSVSAAKNSSVSKAAEALINLSAGSDSVVLSRPDADQQSQEWDRVSHLFENPATPLKGGGVRGREKRRQRVQQAGTTLQVAASRKRPPAIQTPSAICVTPAAITSGEQETAEHTCTGDRATGPPESIRSVGRREERQRSTPSTQLSAERRTR